MKLFLLGMRRSGTTILHDALRADPELRCLYEPLREEDATEGGGSGARRGDAFAETRELRREFRDREYPELPLGEFNWGGPRAPELELEPELPEHCRRLLSELLGIAPSVSVKETRLQHKLPALAEIAPDARVLHVVRDPRAVVASTLLGRRRRRDLYPDADAFFGVHSRRRLWSSRAISAPLLTARGLPAEVPDFLRPLAVWGDALAATAAGGERAFGERYLRVRLEDLRAEPEVGFGRILAWLGRPAEGPVVSWARRHLRRAGRLEHGTDPRWARAVRTLGIESSVERAGYGEIVELEPAGVGELDLEPPPPASPLSAAIGRARRRFGHG